MFRLIILWVLIVLMTIYLFDEIKTAAGIAFFVLIVGELIRKLRDTE